MILFDKGRSLKTGPWFFKKTSIPRDSTATTDRQSARGKHVVYELEPGVVADPGADRAAAGRARYVAGETVRVPERSVSEKVFVKKGKKGVDTPIPAC